MEKIFASIVILYSLFVALYLSWLRIRRKSKRDIVGKGGSFAVAKQLKSEIIGKSTFDIKQLKPLDAKPLPQDSSLPESEKSNENSDTFVPSEERLPSAEEPEKEEENPPMDIEYYLKYEPVESDALGDDEEEETEIIEGAARAARASGVRFEDLGNAFRTVSREKEATPKEKETAGNTLLEIRRTDMFEQLVSENPVKQKTVTELMAESLAAFYRRKDEESGTNGSGKKAPDSFSIRDFA